MNQRLKSIYEVEPVDELLNRAFELAYFILGDRAASIYVAMAAMDKLKTASANQGRRLYYTPTGRSAFPASRTKVNLSELHLLQRLVYVESELFERLIEGQRKTIQQDDLIIRYIKHLVRITTKHNSFYVTLGLCRLLYNYSTGNTSEIYNLVLQDPERIRDDYYYRSRKKRLMEEIKERFGGLLRTQRGLRGEERFQTQEDSQKYAALVRECLVRFTPWNSACVLPKDLDPDRSVIEQFLFEGGDPDQEHLVELNRIHTLIHPECLDRLTAALGLEPSVERLELPAFFVSTEGPRPTEDRFNPTELTDGELDAIRRYLDKNAVHRQHFSQGRLSLLVDGKRESVFQLEPSRGVEFNLRAAAELIEIRSVDPIEAQEASLAVCLLEHDHSGIRPLDSSVALGKLARLSLAVSPLIDDAGEDRGAKLTVGYQQPATAAEIISPLHRLRSWLDNLIDSKPRGGLPLLKPALGLVFVVLCATGLWVFFHSRKSPESTSRVAQLRGDRGDAAPFNPPATAPPAQTAPGLPRKEPRQTSGTVPPARMGKAQVKGSEAIRGTSPLPEAALLSAVKRVYLDPLGQDSFSQAFRENLMAALRGSHRFEVVENRDDADAVLKGSARPTSVGLELVNARGKVIWSLSPQESRKVLSRSPADAATDISKILLDDVERLERKR